MLEVDCDGLGCVQDDANVSHPIFLAEDALEYQVLTVEAEETFTAS
jgi:hypothetical protein